MNERQPTVSVVIPTYNRREPLTEVLRALGQQNYAAGTYEVVVGIDGSADGTAEMLSQIRVPFQLKFATQEHLGTAAARNLALNLAEGEIVLSMDDDIVAHPDLIATHAFCHAASRSSVGIGQIPLHPKARLCAYARYKHRRFEMHYQKMNHPNFHPDFRDCLTGNLSVRREDLMAVGGFDQEFRDYNHEDTELGFRLQRYGLAFHYLPNAIGYHLYEKSFADGCYDAYGDGRSSTLMLRKHPQMPYSPTAYGGGILRSTALWAAKVVGQAPFWSTAQLMAMLVHGLKLVQLTNATKPLHSYFALANHICYWRGATEEGRPGCRTARVTGPTSLAIRAEQTRVSSD